MANPLQDLLAGSSFHITHRDAWLADVVPRAPGLTGIASFKHIVQMIRHNEWQGYRVLRELPSVDAPALVGAVKIEIIDAV